MDYKLLTLNHHSSETLPSLSSIAFSHPLTHILLNLYAHYQDDAPLLQGLRLLYHALLSNNYLDLKYHHPLQKKRIQTLGLSHPQHYIWSKKNQMLTIKTDPQNN